MSRIVFVSFLLLIAGAIIPPFPLFAQDGAQEPATESAAEPAAEPVAPPRELPGEIRRRLFFFEASAGMQTRLWAGRVNGLRFGPSLNAGAGINFNPKWGLIVLGNLGTHEIDDPWRRRTGWAILGLHRHRPREAETWGLGPAWREVSGPHGRLQSQRGMAAVWRIEFFSKPFAYHYTAHMSCFSSQCAIAVGAGTGFYF